MTEQVLVLRDVAVKRSGVAVLSRISTEFAGGQVVALIGPNGAGKSTLLAAIAGLLPCTGSIVWGGRRPDFSCLSYMPQSVEVTSGLTVMEAVLLGRHDCLGWHVKPADLDAAVAALTSLGLEGLAHRRLNSLSGGQRQMVMLAQRFVRRPQLLLLDESTSALDLRHQMTVLQHLRRYVAETGALAVMAIHDLTLAACHADMVMMLAHGTLAAAGPCKKVLTEARLRDAFGIEAEVMADRSGRPIIVPRAAAAKVAVA
jgi:iron complex transport system ATP-binding protein